MNSSFTVQELEKDVSIRHMTFVNSDKIMQAKRRIFENYVTSIFLGKVLLFYDSVKLMSYVFTSPPPR